MGSVIFVFSIGFLFAGIMLAFLIWARKADQFRDIEGVKYRMMDVEQDEQQR